MKLNYMLTTLIIPSFFLGSCGGNTSNENTLNTDTTAQEKPVDPIAVTWAELEADSVAGDTKIIIEGYIGDIGTYVDQTGGKIRVPIYERRNQTAGFKLNLYIPVGTGANQMKELPSEFTPEDIQITCDDNTVITTGARVRIVATKGETYSEGFITADAITLETLESTFNAETLAKAVPLTSELIKDTTVATLYCHLDGKLEIPTIVFSYTNDISLDLKGSSVKDLTSVSVRIGDGPSTMNDLPDNYTNKDLIVRDYNGTEIKYGTTLRLYGTWERYTFESSIPGIFHLEEIEVKK